MIGKKVLALAFALASVAAGAQTPDRQQFPPEQLKRGAEIFERDCSGCHGAHMADPQSAFDLRTFPHDQKSRFVDLVTKGKDGMPPWGDLFKPEDIDALWSYVVAGEQRE